jgi:hypothetical protein
VTPPAEASPESPPRVEWRGVGNSVAILTTLVAATWLLDAWFVVPSRGWEGAAVAGVAAGVCWMSSVLALLVTVGCAKGKQAMAGALGGIIFRTGGPLAAMAVGSQIPFLSRQGFGGQVVVFFLVALAAETVLVVRLANHAFGLKMWR